MLRVLLNRLLTSLPTFLGVTVIAFVLIRLVPGDPVLLMIGERGASPEVLAEMRANLGLDQPLITQYFKFLGNALTGDLGTSVISKNYRSGLKLPLRSYKWAYNHHWAEFFHLKAGVFEMFIFW